MVGRKLEGIIVFSHITALLKIKSYFKRVFDHITFILNKLQHMHVCNGKRKEKSYKIILPSDFLRIQD